VQMSPNAEDLTFEVGGPGSTVLILVFEMENWEVKYKPSKSELTTLLRWVDFGGSALIRIEPHGLDVQPSSW